MAKKYIFHPCGCKHSFIKYRDIGYEPGSEEYHACERHKLHPLYEQIEINPDERKRELDRLKHERSLLDEKINLLSANTLKCGCRETFDTKHEHINIGRIRCEEHEKQKYERRKRKRDERIRLYTSHYNRQDYVY